MCDDVEWGDPFLLQSVPDWFVTQQQLKIWDDYDEDENKETEKLWKQIISYTEIKNVLIKKDV